MRVASIGGCSGYATRITQTASDDAADRTVGDPWAGPGRERHYPPDRHLRRGPPGSRSGFAARRRRSGSISETYSDQAFPCFPCTRIEVPRCVDPEVILR